MGGPCVRIGCGQGHTGSRLQRLRTRQAAQPSQYRHYGRDGPYECPGRPISGFEPGRVPQAGDRGPGGSRIARGSGGLRAPSGPLLPLSHHRGALSLQTVVRQDAAAGRTCDRGGTNGQDQDRTPAMGEDLLRVDVQHTRLVHLEADMVGAPDPGMELQGLRRLDGRQGNTGGVHALWRGRPRARARRAGHLVQLGAVALLYDGLAGSDSRSRGLLSDLGHGHRLRHPVFLGRQNDHDGAQVHGGCSLPGRVYPRIGPGRRRKEDEQVQGKRNRPPRDHRAVRRRRLPVHARRTCGPGP
jgi:hypothetical protein